MALIEQVNHFRPSTLPPAPLIIGHSCHDKVPGGFVPGGAATYAAVLARQLGHPAHVLTAFGTDFQFESLFHRVDLHIVPSAQTTIFENIYRPDGQRIQYLHGRASLLTPKDLPMQWQEPSMALLGPICDEVSFEFLDFFKGKNTITCACPQGWMRQWDDQHRVSPKPIADWRQLAKADIISMSEADVAGDWSLIAHIANIVPLLLVTQGARGVVVYERGEGRHFPAIAVEEIDPTGAGDVFAMAFTLRYATTKDVENAASFAVEVAGKKVGTKAWLV